MKIEDITNSLSKLTNKIEEKEFIWRATPVVASINAIRKKKFLVYDFGSGGSGFDS